MIVALGFSIVLAGVFDQGSQGVTGTTTAATSTAHHASYVPKFLNAEAATAPFNALDYSLFDTKREGDSAAGPLIVQIDPNIVDEHCEYCMKINYSPYLAGKAGIAWTTAQPLDVEGPQRMTFGAKGQYGGEQIRVMILGKQNGTSTSPQDENVFENIVFVSRSEPITLTSYFQRYQIDVPDVDTANFKDVTYPVAIEIDDGSGIRPVVIYLHGFIFDSKEPVGTFVTENTEILEEDVTAPNTS